MIKDIFLKAKHWQLFILMFGVPMIFQFALMGTMLANIGEGNMDPLFMLDYLKFFPVIMLISTGTYFGWFWSIVTGLQNKIPNEVKMKVTKFKIFFFIPLAYLVSILIALGIGLNGMLESGAEPNVGFILGLVGIIVPMHLFSIFCIFYSVYFVAKTIKTAELQREVTFSDFVAEFFLIWFYPVGVWILQPKINQMIINEPSESYEPGLIL